MAVCQGASQRAAIGPNRTVLKVLIYDQKAANRQTEADQGKGQRGKLQLSRAQTRGRKSETIPGSGPQRGPGGVP